MPLYDFKNKETDEYEEHMVKISEYDDFLKDNPHLERAYVKAPALSADGGRDALSRAGDGWKEVQDKIRSGMPPKDRHLIQTK